MRIKTVIGALLLFMTTLCYGQSDLEKAKIQLNQLKESFILVRLQTDSLKLKALESRGLHREAEILKRRQYLENREIILSFQQTFDFCPVYFFYSNKSDEIRKGNIVGNVFDYELEIVSSEKLQSETFFTAEFAKTENLGINALVLMDHFLLPLKAPFPFYQRQYVFFSMIRQGKGTMAKRFNKKLHEYHEAWNRPVEE